MSDVDALVTKRAADVLRDSDRDSVGVIRVLSDTVGKPATEREYEAGDEALVEAGRAEWVVAPVHLPSAGRRLDHDAEREATPRDGVEVYPPAEPTTGDRRAESRYVGHVEAASDEGVATKLAEKRQELAREDAGPGEKGDAALQAELGGHAARSGPVTAQSDLPADKPVESAPVESKPTVAKAAPAKAAK